MPKPLSPPKWKSGALYKFFCDYFPNHRTRLDRLDVHKLATDLGKSYESVYKWLRKGRLNAANARLVLDLANGAENVATLTINGHRPPVIEDLLPCVFD